MYEEDVKKAYRGAEFHMLTYLNLLGMLEILKKTQQYNGTSHLYRCIMEGVLMVH